MYQFKVDQTLDAPISVIWDFISNPNNLSKITPDYMNFVIRTDLAEQMYEGLMISYTVSPILNIPMPWITEITHIEDQTYFVDEQRRGPYRIWHHEHWLKNAGDSKTMMTDIISYLPPLGFLGSIANKLFIRRQLESIFEYRKVQLDAMFNRQ